MPLPPGLSLDPTTGKLTGTPSAPGTYLFTVVADNGHGSDITAEITLVIADDLSAPVFVNETPPLTGFTGDTYSYVFTATGNPDPTFLVPSGAGWVLPPGLSLDSNGTLSGTLDTAGSYAFRVRAINSQGQDNTATITIVVTDPQTAPVWVQDTPGGGNVAVPYSYTFVATGNPDPTYTISAGAPPGLTLNGTTGLFSGSPTTAGSYNFTVTAHNAAGDVATPTINVVIGSGGGGTPPAFTAADPPDAHKAVPYSYTFTASGTAPITFAFATGFTAPPGLSLNASTGVFSGTPTAEGKYTFRVTATNTQGSVTSPKIVMLVLLGPSFTADDPPDGTKDSTYAYSFAAVGYPKPTFSVVGGSSNLPTGLTLNSANGKLSGTPTVVGSYPFQVTATNSSGSINTPVVTVVILDNLQPPVFINDTPPESGSLGDPYDYFFTASGNPPPTFAVDSGSLPDGLTLTSAGELSGTLTTTGLFQFVIRATNSEGTTFTPLLSITVIEESVPPVFNDFNPPDGVKDVSYSYDFNATGVPDPTYTITGSVPPGLNLDATTGVLSGLPTSVGPYSFFVTATNSAGSVDTPSIVVMIFQAPVFTADTPPTGVDGLTYGYNFIAEGYPLPTYTASAGTPPGLALTSTGRLAGTPNTVGTYTFTVTALNSEGSTVTPDCVVTIISGSGGGGEEPVFEEADPPDGVGGDGYSYQFEATGVPNPTFGLGDGALPPGLDLALDGVLLGVPTTPGIYDFTVVAGNVFGSVESDLIEMVIDDTGGSGGSQHVWVTCALIEMGEPTTGIPDYFDGNLVPDCLWEQNGNPGNTRSYYYKNRGERAAALKRILLANVPLGIGIADPQFAVLPISDDTLGMFEPYGSGLYGFHTYGG